MAPQLLFEQLLEISDLCLNQLRSTDRAVAWDNDIDRQLLQPAKCFDPGEEIAIACVDRLFVNDVVAGEQHPLLGKVGDSLIGAMPSDMHQPCDGGSDFNVQLGF